MVKIYYEDNDIVVCEKEYGISSQKSDKENLIDLLNVQLNSEIYPVNRLDIGTTGIMVYAKNQASAAALSKEIADGVFKKAYICLCHGVIDESGEMVDFLYHDKLKNKSFAVKTKRRGTKEARLEYKREFVDNEMLLSQVRVILHTGRTHQIRVQFASRGFVLYGDGKYGAKDNDKIRLHSCEISFNHPVTKEKMCFTSSAKWQMQ